MIPSHQTPFVTSGTVLPTRDGAEELIVLCKATFDVDPHGALTPAPDQDAIVPADRHRGAADATSISHAAEHTPSLPTGTEVFLEGDAVAPDDQTRELTVAFRAGSVDKRVHVTGTRLWHGGGVRATATDPKPFRRIPLIYENAFGGTDTSATTEAEWEREPQNPVGRGFRSKSCQLPWAETALPNLEAPEARISSPDDRPPPRAFGPIGRHWEPRIRYIGTYDDTWLKERMPLLPADFDARFFHAAPPDQIHDGFMQGGETIAVEGATPSSDGGLGVLTFALPTITPNVHIRFFMRDVDQALRCESLMLDTRRSKLHLLYRCVVPLQGDVLDIREIELDAAGWNTAAGDAS